MVEEAGITSAFLLEPLLVRLSGPIKAAEFAPCLAMKLDALTVYLDGFCLIRTLGASVELTGFVRDEIFVNEAYSILNDYLRHCLDVRQFRIWVSDCSIRDENDRSHPS
jgi:hypothetical protein